MLRPPLVLFLLEGETSLSLSRELVEFGLQVRSMQLRGIGLGGGVELRIQAGLGAQDLSS